jgi:hypothetical protein
VAAAPYVLARTMAEAHAFAREDLGLLHGQYRIVNTPSTLKSVRNVDLHLVPGWQNRFDRFAMKGAIRWTRMNVIDVAEQRAQEPSVPDDLEPTGVQLSLVSNEEAQAFFADIEPEPAPEPRANRRRSRCSNCGTLHFKEEGCPSDPLFEVV